MVDAAIISKIQKVMTLAERGGTPEEAAAAAAKVQQLLFRHNLTMTDVTAVSDAQNIKAQYANTTVNLGVERRQVVGWRRDLLAALARLNFCYPLLWRGEPNMQLIGKPENIAAVVQMYEYLATTIDRLSAEGWEMTKKNNGGKAPTVWSDVVYKYIPQHAKNYRGSFSQGAVYTVVDRLKAQRDADIHEHAGSTALMVVTERELEQAANNYYSNIGKAKTKRMDMDANAYESGQRAGAKIGLGKQVGDGANKRALNA